MKSITRITRRLMLVFLALIASSMMLLSSPAIAATSSIAFINPDTFETEVLKSDKPVVVIRTSPDSFLGSGISIEKLKEDAENYFGDKYKIVFAQDRENINKLSGVPVPLIYPPLSIIYSFKNGERLTNAFFRPDHPEGAFEFVKKSFES